MAIKEKKINKITQIEKEVKLSLFIDDMILYIENLKNPSENYYSKSINIVMSHDIKAIKKITNILIH